MLHLNQAIIQQIQVHTIGKPGMSQDHVIAHNSLDLHDQEKALLRKYLFKPMNELVDTYEFSDTSENPIFTALHQYFSNTSNFTQLSQAIATELIEASRHPNIKPGQLFVAKLEDVIEHDQAFEAIGIFKAEMLSNFYQVNGDESKRRLDFKKGYGLKKLDKGCIVLYNASDNAFNVYCIDNNLYSATYWLHDFLNVVPQVNVAQTHSALDLIAEFSQEVITPQLGKMDHFETMAKTNDYFQNKSHFELEEFVEEVLPTPSFQEQFKNFTAQKSIELDIEPLGDFDFAPAIAAKALKRIHKKIELDDHIQIQLNFADEEDSKQFIHKGFDEAKQMHFYTIYYKEEK